MANVVSIPSQQQAKKQRFDFSEIGLSGLRRFGGTVNEEFLKVLQGRRGIQVYREMRDNDDIIGASMLAIEQVISKASWFIKPFDSSPLQLKAADFLRTCMDDMSHTWHDFIRESLTFLTYGWSWFELVYKLRKGENNNPQTNSRYSDGLIGWRKIPLRMQASLHEWKFNEEDGGVLAMVQQPPPVYDFRVIPLNKSLLFRVKIDGNNPEGRAILRNTYRPYFFKKAFQEIEAIGAERDLVGLPIFKPPEAWDIEADDSAPIRTYVHKLIGNLRRDEQEGILLPGGGWDISLLTIGGSRRQFDLDRILNRYDKRIAITMLAQFIMLGMERVGSFALSRNQNDLFLIAAQGYLDIITEILNRFAIPRLLALNPVFMGLDGKYPQFVPGAVSAPPLTEISQFINQLAQVGLVDMSDELKDELMRMGGFIGPQERRLGEVRRARTNNNNNGQNQNSNGQNQNNNNNSQSNRNTRFE